MSQDSKQQETDGVVKYHELKRPLTKEEKEEIEHKSYIENIDLHLNFERFPIFLVGALGFSSLGGLGIGFAKIATTPAGVFIGSVIGAVGCILALSTLGITVYDTYKYFSSHLRRVHALEQEKIKENTKRDSQELQRVREEKIAEARRLREELNKRQELVIEREREKREQKSGKSAPVRKTAKRRNALKAKEASLIRGRAGVEIK